jgi:rare lipoprotein A
MNQRFWNGVTITLLTTIFGTATSGYAQQAKPVDQDSEGDPPATQVRLAPGTAPFASESQPVQSEEVVKVGELKSQAAKGDQREVIAKIHSYESAGRQAATLYVHSIPVLTFLGSGSVTAQGTKMGEGDEHQKVASRDRTSEATAPKRQASTASEANNAENDALWRATAVAARINQLSRDNVDAKAIAAYWNAKCSCYSIKVNDEELVQINEKTTLPDTTQNLAEDALQATNRLRRLMGNAPPVREIVGKPPMRAVARVSLGSIRLQITGFASWYGPGFHGNRSASGEVYNQNAMTAAHRSLPFGTNVQVTNLDNGRSVVVRINDRGPYVGGRVIDLSAAAARVLGLVQSGVAPVRLDIIDSSQKLANEN